jgi:hypothetical protein
MRRTAIVIALLGGGALVVVEYLNFSGFCYAQSRYLSPEELTTAAIKENLRRHSPEPNSSRRKIYESIEDFHRQNADCCEINRWNVGSLGVPIWLRLFGYYEVAVSIVYRVNDFGGVDNFYASTTIVDSCGGIRKVQGEPWAENLRIRKQ